MNVPVYVVPKNVLQIGVVNHVHELRKVNAVVIILVGHLVDFPHHVSWNVVFVLPAFDHVVEFLDVNKTVMVGVVLKKVRQFWLIRVSKTYSVENTAVILIFPPVVQGGFGICLVVSHDITSTVTLNTS